MKAKAINNIVECEVLVIGSGLAGSLAAIGCRQLGKKVVIVNKGRLCWGGSTIVCGGRGTSICLPTDDKEVWLKEIVEASEYSVDQEWVKIFLEKSYGYAMDLNQLGKEYNETIFPARPDDEKGGLWRFQGYGERVPTKVLINVFAAASALRKRILADKITFLERVEMTDLLTDGQRIIGGVGFNYRNGGTYLFKAKAIILAAGSCHFTSEVRDGCGEGLAMAYHAGARMRSLDRGGAHIRPRNTMYTGVLGDAIPNGLPYCLGGKLVNGAGETFFDKHSAEMRSSARLGLTMAIHKEIMEGKGPILEDYTQIPPEVQVVLKSTKRAAWKLAKAQYGVDVFQDKVILGDREEQTAVPAAGTRAGGVEVDYQCASSIPGLYAVGDNACSPISMPHPFGAGLAWAIISGMRIGQYVSEYVNTAPSQTLTDKNITEQTKKCIDTLALPLIRTRGISPEEVISRLLHCMIPYNKVHSDRDTIERALTNIARIQKEDLPNVKATDYHNLKKAVELQCMVLTSEMILKSELFREESRCGVRRKDFPMTDNINWLKWILIEKQGGKMHIYTKDVPTPYVEPPRTVYSPQLARS